MFGNVIVPLDGSPLAENVLPYVDTVVRGCSTMVVVFLRVVEPAVYLSGDGKRDPLKWDVAERMDARGKQEAQHYLAEVVGKAGYAGVDIRQVVLLGKPADVICEFANNNGADLIIMATHGRTGVKRLVWGSVAEKVLRFSCVPVLLIRPPGCAPGF